MSPPGLPSPGPYLCPRQPRSGFIHPIRSIRLNLRSMKFATKAIHAGVHPDPETGAIMTPIYQTSTYVQRSPGDHRGYEYSRTHNPTRTQLQDAVAALENGRHGLAFASGMAAIDCLIKLLQPGD